MKACGKLSVRCGPMLLLLLVPSAGVAAETGEAASEAGGLSPLDWVILVLYAGSTIGLGWFYSRRQRSTREYFVGSGRMNPILIGVSLFATLLSTISYLSIPGEAIGKGPVSMTNMLAYPIIFLIVGFVLLPVYMRHRVTSAYELLEARLGPGVRLLGMGMFLILRLVWMSLLIYLTGKALAVMMDVDVKWVPLIVLVTGAVAITYTTMGGLRAVVITDLMQTLLLYGGAVIVLVMVTVDYGGLGWFPTEWQPNWDHQPIFSFDPTTRVTVVGSILSALIWYVATSGGDQVSVQRFMATQDAKAARRAFAVQLCVAIIVSVTLMLVGFALLGHFRTHPELVPAGMSLKENADDIFPRFITFHLPPGISGLVVAAMFAAAMSSIDSGVNSITAVLMTDLGRRRTEAPLVIPLSPGGASPRGAQADAEEPVHALDYEHPDAERRHVRTARLLAVGIGATVVLASSLMQYVPGNITAMTAKTSNLLTVPIFCLFFLALFVPFANAAGAWIGTACGVTTAVLTAFSGPIFGVDPVTGLDPVSFQWISPCALVVGLTTGVAGSVLFPSSGGTAMPKA